MEEKEKNKRKKNRVKKEHCKLNKKNTKKIRNY